MKKLILGLMLIVSFANAKCCCEGLINRLISSVEDKLDTTIEDDTSAMDDIIDSTDKTSEDYLVDLVENLESKQLDSKEKLKKFLITDAKHLYSACAKAAGLIYFQQIANNKTILDIIDKEVNSLEFVKISSKVEQNNIELNQINSSIEKTDQILKLLDN